MTVPIGILAAGSSSRMRGRDKLLEPVDGEPLLARQIRVAQATSAPVLVALPPDSGHRHRITANSGAETVIAREAAEGLAGSIRALIEACRDRYGGLLLTLADMPEIDTQDLQKILEAARSDSHRVVRAATEDLRPGHPVCIPVALFDAVSRLHGDVGARAVLESAADVRLVALAGARARCDLDTPEAWSAWRRRRSTDKG